MAQVVHLFLGHHTSVLDSGWYVLGKQVKELEREFAAYCQTVHCVSVANGTDALELALRALGVGQDDKIISVANAGARGGKSIFPENATGSTVYGVCSCSRPGWRLIRVKLLAHNCDAGTPE